MDLIEKIYEGKIDFKKFIGTITFDTDKDINLYYNAKKELFESLNEKQKDLFENFDERIEDRMNFYKKQVFKEAFAYGLKMGIEAKKTTKDFDFDNDFTFASF